MMKVRTFQSHLSRIMSGLGLACMAVTLSACVTYGNTHALITPVGVAGYHTFKPDHAKAPREINLPEQSSPDRIAAANESDKKEGGGDGI